MKKLFLYALVCIPHAAIYAQKEKKFNDTAYLQSVEVQATRAGEKSPFAKTDISKEEIRRQNLGQDLPFLLNQTPGVVVNSDAGNGVGYTGIRIRGTDATRINVTLNGIPYNDAESQGTFFVDMPDIASSTSSIQVQRGIGTSTNGAGAFGGSINIFSNELNKEKYLELNNSYGSFNTWKNTLRFGTGLLGKHFTLDGRLSHISSDGYMDRAESKLRSLYLSAAYTTEKNSLRFNIISGKEKTYQAWNGVPESLLQTHRTFNPSGNERSGEPYDNETDNYTQTHYQLFYNHRFNEKLKGSIALFLTRGKGYYEQYKADETLADYGLPDYNDNGTPVSSMDIVRQLWLDNYFYGTVFSLNYKHKKTLLQFGGSYTVYDGDHYGIVKWGKIPAAIPNGHRWYDNPALKKNFSVYSKWTQEWGKGWQTFADLQYNYIDYDINGFRNNPAIELRNKYHFLNPKLGITYTHNNWETYFSYAFAGKEPNRDDFEAGNTEQPKAEYLNDFEAGIRKRAGAVEAGINLYYMRYRNQLVLTGKINDVGAYTRTNIPNSYRAGIELEVKLRTRSWLNLGANISFSENRIRNFTEYLDDYDNGGQQTKFYPKTTIAFSPAVTAGGNINFVVSKKLELSLIPKYVSRQYLDNTAQRSRSLDPYYLQDVRIALNLEGKLIKSTNLVLQLNNVFNKKYEPNGYTFSYIYGGVQTTENYYFPMAGFNWMIGLNLRF